MPALNSLFLDSENSSFDRSNDIIPSPPRLPRSQETHPSTVALIKTISAALVPIKSAWDQRPRGLHRVLRNRRIVLLVMSCAFILTYIATFRREDPVGTLLGPNQVRSGAVVRKHKDLGRRLAHGKMQPLWGEESLQLNAQEELAALVAFMAASESNALPLSIDLNNPLDAAYILGFDPHAKRAKREVLALVRDTWENYPVVLLSRRYSPAGREIRSMLSSFKMEPAPLAWDLDEREDRQVTISVIFRLTNMTELPILLYRGSVVGGAGTAENGTKMIDAHSATYIERIRSLNETGALRRLLTRETRAETSKPDT